MWGYILLTAKTDLGLNTPAFRWGIRDTYFSYGFLHLPVPHLHWSESEYMTKAWSGPGKLLIKGIINESNEVKLEFKHNFAYIFHSLLFSCLPGWKSDTGMDITYMLYICIAGGLIPSMIIVVTNGYLLHTIHRVSLLEWFMLRLCNLI